MRALYTFEAEPEKENILGNILFSTLLKRTVTLAAFVAPDLARTMAAADVNVSCGAIMD